MTRFLSEDPPPRARGYVRAAQTCVKPAIPSRKSFVSSRVIPAASVWMRKTSAARFYIGPKAKRGEEKRRGTQRALSSAAFLLLCICSFVFVVHVETFRLWHFQYSAALACSIGFDLAHIVHGLFRWRYGVSRSKFSLRKIGGECLRLELPMGTVLVLVQCLPVYTLGAALSSNWLQTIGLLLRLTAIVSAISAFESLQETLHNQAARRLLRLLSLLMFLTYALSCGYFALSRVPGWYGHQNSSLTQSKHQFSYSPEDQWNDLALATYFSVQTLFTIGYGDIVPQTLEEITLTCAFMCVTILFKAYFIASMTTILGNINYSGSLFKRKMESIRRYMRRERLSPELQQKVETVFGFLWERQRGRIDEDLLAELPEPMIDMVISGKAHWLFLIPFFRSRNASFIQDVVLLLQNQVLTFGEVLVRSGESCSNMYMLMSGMLHVLKYAESNEKQFVIDRLLPGTNGFLGEQMIFFARPIYTHTVEAGAISEVHRLSREDLESTIKKYRKLKEQGDKLVRRLRKKKQGFGNLLCTLTKNDTTAKVSGGHIFDAPQSMKTQPKLLAKLQATLAKKHTNEVTPIPPPLEDIHGNPRCDPAAAETLDNYNDKLRQIQGRGGSLASVDLNLSQRRLVDRLKACIIKSYTAIQTTLQNSRLWFVVILFAHLWCVVQVPLFWDSVDTKYMAHLLEAGIGDVAIFLDVLFIPRPLLRSNDASSRPKSSRKFEKNRVPSGFVVVRESRSFWNWLIYHMLLLASMISLVLGVLNFTIPHFVLRSLGLLALYPVCTDFIQRFQDNFHMSISLSEKVLVTFCLVFLALEVWVGLGWFVLNTVDHVPTLLSGVYWALVTSTGVGFGDIVAEDELSMFYAICVITTCSAVYISYLSTLVSLFKPPSISGERIEHFENCLDHFVSQTDLSENAKTKCKQFRNFIKSQGQETVNDKYMFESMMPDSVLKSYRKELVEDTLLKHNGLFIKQDPETLSAIASVLHHDIFFPGNAICGGGKSSSVSSQGLQRCMVFLESGEAFVISPQNKEVRKVVTGMSFGEIELFRPGTTMNRLLAITFCSVYHLKRGSFLRIMKDVPCKEPEASSVVEELEKRAIELTRKLDENVQKNLASNKLAKLKGGDSLGSSSKSVPAKFSVDSPQQRIWQLVESTAMLFHLLYLPYQFCFGFGTVDANMNWLLLLYYLADAVSIVAMILRYNYFQTNSEVAQVSVRRAYLSRTVYFDMVSILPIDVIVLLIRSLSIQAYVTARLTRLARIYVLRGLIRTIGSAKSLLANVGNFCILLVSVGTFAHWAGCAYFLLARGIIMSDSYNPDSKVWLVDGSFPIASVIVTNQTKSVVLRPEAYSWSLYWSFTVVTTVGYGDLHPVNEAEKLYAILLMVLSGVLYAVILSKLEEIVAQSDVSSLIYQRKVDELRDYGKLRGLPKELAQEIATYNKHLLNKNGGVDSWWIIKKLPITLRREVIAEMGGSNFLSQFPYLSANGHTAALLDLFESVFYLARTAVYLKGQVHQTLYVVSHGEVLLTEAGRSRDYKSFLPGNCFGHLEFFFDEPAPAMAVTELDTLLLYINKRKLKQFLRDNNDLEEIYNEALQTAKPSMYKDFSLEGFQKNLKSSKLAKVFTDAAAKPVGVGRELVPPDHIFRVLWNSVMLCVLFFNCFGVSYLVFFHSYDTGHGDSFVAFLFVDILCDLLQLYDVYLRAFRFAFTTYGSVETSPRRSRQKYLRSYFVVDFLAIFPVQYILLVVETPFPVRVAALGRVNRVLYAVHALELLKSAERLLYRYSVLLRAASWNLVRICLVSFMVVHVVACVYAHLSFDAQDFAAEGSQRNLYFMSLYWSLYTVSTVGFGNLATPGPVFASLCMVLGCFVLDAAITAAICNMLSNEESRSDNGRYSKECLEVYMHSRHIRKDVQVKVREYLEYHVTSGQSIVEKRLFVSLPEYYRVELARSVVVDRFQTIQAHPLFAQFDIGLLRTMASRLFPATFPSEQVLVGDNACFRKQRQSVFRRSSGSAASINPLSLADGGEVSEEAELLKSGLDRDVDPFELSQVGNVLFLISGQVMTSRNGLDMQVQSGIITGSSGIKSAVTKSLCHFFALSLESYIFLKSYDKTVWQKATTFEEVLSDNRGFLCVRRMCKKSVPELSIVQAWNYLRVYHATPQNSDVRVELLRNVRTYLMGQKVTSYISGSEVLSNEEEAFIDSIHTKDTISEEDSMKLQLHLLQILEHNVYPKFLISYEFYLFTMGTEDERRQAGVSKDTAASLFSLGRLP